MRNFTRRLFVILLCTLATIVVAQVSDQEHLIGDWELLERRATGMGSTYSFRSDGALVITSGVMIDFDARAEGNELLATMRDKTGNQPVRVRAAGDTLTLMQRGQPQNWVRLGRAIPGQPAFAGAWAVDQSAEPRRKKKDDEMGELLRENMRMTITPAASAGTSTPGLGEWTVHIRCPIENDGGSYTVQGSKLIMQYGGKVWVAAFRVNGNNLYLMRRGDKNETVFERAE